MLLSSAIENSLLGVDPSKESLVSSFNSNSKLNMQVISLVQSNPHLTRLVISNLFFFFILSLARLYVVTVLQ